MKKWRSIGMNIRKETNGIWIGGVNMHMLIFMFILNLKNRVLPIRDGK